MSKSFLEVILTLVSTEGILATFIKMLKSFQIFSK